MLNIYKICKTYKYIQNNLHTRVHTHYLAR